MEITGNMVKAKIAALHNIKPEQVVMNALRWQILIENHAAIVWYNITGDKFGELPYAAVAIDNEVYVYEHPYGDEVKNAEDIERTDAYWIRLSDGIAFNGTAIVRILKQSKGSSIC